MRYWRPESGNEVYGLICRLLAGTAPQFSVYYLALWSLDYIATSLSVSTEIFSADEQVYSVV
jgi:hypothetical protein